MDAPTGCRAASAELAMAPRRDCGADRGKQMCLWRPVGAEGEILDTLGRVLIGRAF